jgi:tetratricopeptide (TPR) repeat protein
MAKDSQGTGRERPWKLLRTPPPREWIGAPDPRTQAPSEVSVVLAPEVPGLFGVELHLILRELRTWAGTPLGTAPKRKRVAPHVAERRGDALLQAPEKLRPAIRVLTHVSASRTPSIDEIQAATLAITEWAQEEGHNRTATDFAEACAGVLSDDALWVALKERNTRTLTDAAWGAFVAARTNRTVGENWRAEVFYSRAIRFANWAGERAKKDSPDRKRAWSIYVRARLGFGRLHQSHKRFRAAKRHYRAAARRARIEGEEWLSAQTYHDMLLLTIEEGLLASVAGYATTHFAEARTWGRVALDIYPRHHERFPAAVHDFVLSYVCEHRYANALPLLELLMQAPIPYLDRVIGWSTLARSAGSLGDAERFATGEAHVLELSPHYEHHAAPAYVNLAFGARGLGEWRLARQYVARGIAIAEARGDRLAAQVGRALLREIKAGAPGPPPAPPLEGPDAEALDELAEAVADQLASWRGPTWTKKENQYGLATLGAV